MKNNYESNLEIPSGVNCSLNGNVLHCAKGSVQLTRVFGTHNISVSVKGNQVVVECKIANRKGIANVNAYAAHVRNMFQGLNERFVYEMEICNVHFPMTVKIEKDSFVITNFLGEKVPRIAKILPGVEVKVDGSKIKISSADVDKAGQTAANIEKASQVRGKDRRIFQDGCFITKKPEVVK